MVQTYLFINDTLAEQAERVHLSKWFFLPDMKPAILYPEIPRRWPSVPMILSLNDNSTKFINAPDNQMTAPDCNQGIIDILNQEFSLQFQALESAFESMFH